MNKILIALALAVVVSGNAIVYKGIKDEFSDEIEV